ncbi:hypothetical protein BCV69DRAFT_164544 [Microstroma glucosiphilum]|uniref:Pericentrin/AKAP-450 centrosomal targeting domain-containing protein n=1 Tax=Pseudomicrostroma glucosiphilum TaxID=1684307 RepID=A0A316U7N1_9BASI|nr:hypothetical protein BCV69DRAFT_164544 [Pseudomicrostroma glucosiphilum]PWN21256.1 hypothetical protein BCV69DRAFT_164544 [Pseudomicrostroma glucosiphilum]
MNGSFEAASHLERAIRAGLEDQSDSSLSAPGLARRAKSASLSFATDEGSDEGHTGQSYQPSTNRILDHLSEYDSGAFAGRTPTARRMVTATQNITSHKQQQQRPYSSPSQPLTSSRNSARRINKPAQYAEEDEDSRDDSMLPPPKATDSRSSSLSSSESGMRTTARDISHGSAPLTSTPQRSAAAQRSRDATSFYSQRSNGDPTTGRLNLAKRAAQSAARDASTRSLGRRSDAARSEGEGSHTPWGSAKETQTGLVRTVDENHDDHTGRSAALSDGRDLSINTIEEADSADQTRQSEELTGGGVPEQDASRPEHTQADSIGQTSQMHTSDIRPVHQAGTEADITSANPDEPTQDNQSQSHNPFARSGVDAVNETENVTVEATRDSAPETSPSAARAARQALPPLAATPSYSQSRAPFSMATPRPAVDQRKMQNYLLSVVKDPAREQKIQKSVKRMRAQRIPLDQIQSEESSMDRSGPQAPVGRDSTPLSSAMATPLHRMDRLGRPMTIGAGRTPLPPFRPSGLANQYSADDSRSQASDQSSVHDLVGPSRWENKSEPGTVAREGKVIEAGLRVDGNRLDRHLHRVNAELSKENDRLADENAAKQGEVETLRRQLNTALREKEMLVRQSQASDGRLSPASVPLPPSPAPDSAKGHSEDAEALASAQEKITELEGHKEQLNDMLDELEEQFLQLQTENDQLKQGKTSSKQQDDGREDQTAATATDEADVKAQLEEAIRELDLLDQDYQDKEQECQQLQEAFEEAKEFALQECQKAEEERDRALKTAADREKEIRDLCEQIGELETNLQRLRQEKVEQSDDQAATVESEKLRDEVAKLQKELAAAQKELEAAHEEHDNVREELEAALEGNELQLQDLEKEKALVDEDLRQAVQEAANLKDNLDRQVITVSEKENEILKLTRRGRNDDAAVQRLAELEASLEAARHEAASSKDKLASMVSRSEHDKELKLRQEEIDLLRKQKTDIEARLEDYKQQASNLSLSPGGGQPNSSMLKTPGMHKALLNLRTPIRTPQSPGQLSAASWLNDSTIGNESAVMHIQELQRLLDEANVKIDEKLAEIDRQGLSHLTVTRRLLEAHQRIEELEAELARLLGSGGELHVIDRRLKSIRCTSCKITFDASKQVQAKSFAKNNADDESFADVTVTSHTVGQGDKKGMAKSARSRQRDQALADFVAKVPILTARLAQVEEENRKLREGAAAKGSAGKNNARSDARATDAAKNLQKATQFEIEKARAAIVDLDSELQEERKRLPELARDSKVFGDLTSSAERDLARTELRLRNIEVELRRKVEDHGELYKELLEKSSVGSDVPVQLQVLQAQVRQTAMDVEHLRDDRNAVLEAREELHDKFRNASEKYLTIQTELTTCRQAVLSHASQLDEQTQKIEELHATLKEQHRAMQRVAGERDRLYAQREGIINDVSSLEADLRRVRVESQAFGRDLERLRKERDEQKRRAELARETSMSITAEAQETISVLKERLDQARRMIRQVELSQTAEGAQADTQALREKHERECKGLLLHARYLKTKFMRESDLRADLAFQKKYLLQILGGLDMSERETVRFLSDLERSRGRVSAGNRTVGGGGGSAPRRSPATQAKWKKVSTAVLAVARMKLMAERWQETRKVKEALLGAHEAVKLARAEKERENARSGGEEEKERMLYHKVAA